MTSCGALCTSTCAWAFTPTYRECRKRLVAGVEGFCVGQLLCKRRNHRAHEVVDEGAVCRRLCGQQKQHPRQLQLDVVPGAAPYVGSDSLQVQQGCGCGW